MTNSADYLCALISELLYEHRQLHLPGLGAFLLQYKPAIVDNLQGQLLPPSLDLSFDTNLVMDDGLLLEHLRQRTGWSAEVADEAISSFVAGIVGQLSRGELVHLPNIGRLHLNHEKKIVFKADNYNYNKDSFGLPVLQAAVVTRQANSSAAATTAGSTPVQSAAKVSGLRPWYWLFGVFALLTAGIIFASLYINRLAAARQAAEQAAMEGETAPADARINVAPSADLPAVPDAQDEEAVEPSPSDASTATADKQEKATEPAAVSVPAKPAPAAPAPAKPAAAARTSVAWIAVGKFANADNAARMNQRIAEAGYEPFSNREGDLTRVGILLPFRSEAELQQQLGKIKRQLAPGAFVVKRESLGS